MLPKCLLGNLGFTCMRPQQQPKYQLLLEGKARLTLDVFRDFGGAFIVTLLLIYLVFVAFYRSIFMSVIIKSAHVKAIVVMISFSKLSK